MVVPFLVVMYSARPPRLKLSLAALAAESARQSAGNGWMMQGRAAISTGKQAGNLKVGITEPGDESLHHEGTVRFIDNTVDTGTGTIQLKAELPNRDEKLLPGQFLNVALVLDTLKSAVCVPDNAVQQGADGNFLYTLKEDGSVEMRRIEVLAAAAGLTAIGGNLKAGETVITDGHLRLVPGAKVRVKDEVLGAKAAGK